MAGLRVEVVPGGAPLGPEVREQLLRCWVDVTNAGGAVGFPFPAVTAEQVTPALDGLLAPGPGHVLVAHDGARVAGWVHLAPGATPLTAHWGTVSRLQSRPELRGQGVGSALLSRLEQTARDDLGLEHLWLALRSGLGLEEFYVRRGWQVAGRHEGALRLRPGDTRDEVLMRRVLGPAAAPAAAP